MNTVANFAAAIQVMTGAMNALVHRSGIAMAKGRLPTKLPVKRKQFTSYSVLLNKKEYVLPYLGVAPGEAF